MNVCLPTQEHNDAIMLAVLPVPCALILMSRLVSCPLGSLAPLDFCNLAHCAASWLK